jgi:RecA/RadA recombinase
MSAFLKNFRKSLDKMSNVSTGFAPPTYWYQTGNYALNRVLSGSYFRAIPQGRITSLAGPSAAGKSYISCNIIREVQKTGANILILDSENALDPVFMKRAGINPDDESLIYTQVVTIQDVTAVISDFLVSYEKEYGRFNKSAPRTFILLDSLGNLLTNSEDEKFKKGEQTGDQGQSAKLKKHLLRTLVPRLDRCNCTFLMTDQVYPADPLEGDGHWSITNGVKYSASQIILLTKLKLKIEGVKEMIGIRMSAETYKSRFAKPGSKIELEIPFATGLSTVTGCLDSMIKDAIVQQSGAWYTVDLPEGPLKFQRKEFDDALALKILMGNPKARALEAEFEKMYNCADPLEFAGLEVDEVL